MKTAVYTIARNEEKHAEAFMKYASGADIIVVGDSGSTDRTREIVKDMGGHIVPLTVVPWRFDIPRNTVLSMLPADIDFCMALDLDETLPENWRDLIEQNWKVGVHKRFRFRYAHYVKDDGSYGTVGMKDFAHARNEYIWRHAVHETLYYVGEGKEEVLTLPDFIVEHRQDTGKDRSNYLDLLEVECNSPTVTARHIFWLAREYIYKENWEAAMKWFRTFLDKGETWYVERAHAMRWMAKCLAHLKKPTEALSMHFQAIETAPGEREMWLDLGWYHHGREQWAQAYGAVIQGLSISGRPEHYLSTEEAWGYKIHDLAALCAFKLGMTDAAQQHIKTALRMAPHVEHVQRSAQNMGVSLDG